MPNVGLQQQLANFHVALDKYDTSPIKRDLASDWFIAFQQLVQLLENGAPGKKIIFLDELPWLDTPKSGFISALEHFWNSWASARADILLVACGSAAAWMINKLINNKGGLHNRVTHRIRLNPFTLKECEDFFESRSAAFDRYQIVQLYMVMGGIQAKGLARTELIKGAKEKNSLYQLTDFYSLFYLKFIKNGSILDENSWINGLDNSEQRAWSGYAFEVVCAPAWWVKRAQPIKSTDYTRLLKK